MRKEIFEKLDQQDRIEYLLLEQKNKIEEDNSFLLICFSLFIIASVMLVGATVIKGTWSEEEQYVKEGLIKASMVLITLGIILYLMFGVAIPLIGNKISKLKLDKRYLSKLDIKAKGKEKNK